MCVYSMIADDFIGKWAPVVPTETAPWPPYITPESVDDFKRLIGKAAAYDQETGQRDCELEDKKVVLRRLLEEAGYDASFLDSDNAMTLPDGIGIKELSIKDNNNTYTLSINSSGCFYLEIGVNVMAVSKSLFQKAIRAINILQPKQGD